MDETLCIRNPVYSEHPKVSVIVPIYRVDKYLVACLNSIVNQTMEDLEIIPVDEGEQDRCREIIDYFAASDPRIVAPHQKNGGYGASVNLGIQMARGEYLAIVESDDFIELDMYEEMYAYAKKLDADVVKTPYYEYRNDGTRRICEYRNLMRERTPYHKVFSVRTFGELLQVHASLWSGIYKTSYMRRHSIQFVEAPGAAYVDVGFRIQTLIHTDRIAWLDKPCYNYRVESENSSTNNFRLMPMLQRWREVHEFFSPLQKDYDRYYGRYLIKDEYLNSLGWASLIEVSDVELELMFQNLSYVKDSVINNSPALDPEQKKEIIEFKKEPYETMKRLQQRAQKRNQNPFSQYSHDARFTFPYEYLRPKSNLIIYGGGVVGKTFLYQLGATRYCNVVAVCDAKPEESGIHELPVISPLELAGWKCASYDHIVIAIEKEATAKTILNNLVNTGIQKEKILWIDPTK